MNKSQALIVLKKVAERNSIRDAILQYYTIEPKLRKRIGRGQVHTRISAVTGLPINNSFIFHVKSVLKDLGARETVGNGKKYYSGITIQ